MPTYAYQCENGHLFDLFQKMSDKPRAKCPTCGARAQRKISGGAGLIFKGSGFYITDYGKDGKGPAKEKTETAEKAEAPAKSDAAGSKGSESGAAKPSEKPSEKPEKKAGKAAS